MENKIVPLDELKTAPEWIKLTNTQRAVVTQYIQNGYDKEAACKSVFKCATPHSTLVTVNRAFGNADVKNFLALHFGRTSLDRLKDEIRSVLASAKVSPQRISALRLWARIEGIDLSAVASPESFLPEGKIIGQKESVLNGRKIRTVVTDLGPEEMSK